MRMFLMLVLLFSLTIESIAATINIPLDYPTIQQGIDNAVNNDTVLVAPGIYAENIDFKGKAIRIKSTGGPSATVIDGYQNGSVIVFVNDEKSDTSIEGFTITNGTGTFDSYLGFELGGGVYCKNASPSITGNIIKENTAIWGGGICCDGNQSKPIITHCSFIKNAAYWATYHGSRGGGILCYKSSAQIKYCLFKENTAEFSGGAVAAHGGCSPVIMGNLFDSNAAQCDGASFGGGFGSTGGVTPVIMENTFINNKALGGGAISLYEGDVLNNIIMYNRAETVYVNNTYAYGGGIFATSNIANINNNIIAHNTALTVGGGMCLNVYKGSISNNLIYNNSATGGNYPNVPKVGGGIAFTSSSGIKDKMLTNCLIYGNSADDFGGGVYLKYETVCTMLNCTVINNTANDGGGVYCSDKAVMAIKNSIVFNNTVDDIGYFSTPPVVEYSDIGQGFPGAGNINADPLFVDPANDDFHLTYQSPCKDTGDNSAVTVLNDFEGDPRIVNGEVDMGADEFHAHLYYTGDATPGSNIILKFIETPNTAPVVLWLGSGTLNPPMVLPPHGYWYLQFPILLQAQLGSIPGPEGVLSLPLKIPGNLNPMNLPLQAGIGMRLSNLCELKIQ